MLVRPKTEQAWYKLLETNTKEAVAWKARFDARYHDLKTWLREIGGLQEYVRCCAEYALQGGLPEGFSDGLNSIHPRALMLIAKFGEEYTGLSWKSGIEPEKGGCFANARMQQFICNRHSFSTTRRMYYVEGVGFGGRTAPVHHAWNAYTNHATALDWTWHSVASWCLYFGIPLTQGQFRLLRQRAYPGGKTFHLLFSQKVFPPIEEMLTTMLEERRAQLQKKLDSCTVVPDRDY